jgi:hypothetical protein
MLTGMAKIARPHDFTYLSRRNDGIRRKAVKVANGATFVALDMPLRAARVVERVLYLHVHRRSRKCYVGITIMPAWMRWGGGTQYRKHRHFGPAIAKHGWDGFHHYILAFFDNRDAASEAEVAASAAAGGHKSKLTFNNSPGGDAVSDTSKPLVGVNRATGETREFKSSMEVARELGCDADGAARVARGDGLSVAGWWFRYADDPDRRPPEKWGRELQREKAAAGQGRPIEAINLRTTEEAEFGPVGEASRVLQLHQSAILHVLHGKAHRAGDWWLRDRGSKKRVPKVWGTAATRAKRDVAVYSTNLRTLEQRQHRNATVANQELGLVSSAAASVLSGSRASAGTDGIKKRERYWFSCRERAKPPALFGGKLVAHARSKPVVAINDKTGQEMPSPSAKAAAAMLGANRSCICLVIRSGKATNGWRFRFA